MSTSTSSTPILRRLAAAGAFAAVLSLGVGSAAAQDQHSGGVSPNSETHDPGDPKVEVNAGGASRGGLPVTGSDVAGLTALGLVGGRRGLRCPRRLQASHPPERLTTALPALVGRATRDPARRLRCSSSCGALGSCGPR